MEGLKKGVSHIANGSKCRQTTTIQSWRFFNCLRTNRDPHVPPISHIRLWGWERLIRTHPPIEVEGSIDEGRELFFKVEPVIFLFWIIIHMRRGLGNVVQSTTSVWNTAKQTLRCRMLCAKKDERGFWSLLLEVTHVGEIGKSKWRDCEGCGF